MARKSALRFMSLFMIAILSLLPMATAMAASPQQDVNTDLVGLWVSEESTEGETVTLSLFDDGSMQGLSEFTGGEDDILYAGEWADNGDDTVSVLIFEVDGLAIGDEPFEIVFDVVSDSELNAAETTDFGDDGMTITWEDSEPLAFVDDAGDDASSDSATDTEESADSEAIDTEVAPGLYVSSDLGAEGAPVGAFVHLNEDGSYQSVVATFDGESATITQLGSWVDNGDGTATLTSAQEVNFGEDGAEYIDLDEPVDLEFEVAGAVLTGEFFNLYAVAAVEEQLGGFAGDVEAAADDEASADDAVADDDSDSEELGVYFYMSSLEDILAGNLHSLELWDDGTATFTFGTDETDTVTELGTWDEDSDGIITVELALDENGDDLDEPSTIVFEPDEDGNLTATDFDADRYGESIVLELTDGQ